MFACGRALIASLTKRGVVVPASPPRSVQCRKSTKTMQVTLLRQRPPRLPLRLLRRLHRTTTAVWRTWNVMHRVVPQPVLCLFRERRRKYRRFAPSAGLPRQNTAARAAKCARALLSEGVVYFVGWFAKSMNGQSVGQLVGRSVGRPVGPSVGR